MKSATNEECYIFVNMEFISSASEMQLGCESNAPMDATFLPLCYTAYISIYISLNFARHTNYQRKPVNCISKLVCSEFGALS